MNNTEKLLLYLENHQATVTELAEHLAISRQAVHRTLKRLLGENRISKIGMPPKVYYMAVTPDASQASVRADDSVESDVRRLIEDNFLYITSFGQKQLGWSGFVTWCNERKQDISKMAKLYQETQEKYNRYKKDGIINGMDKFQSTFDDVALDEVFYIDFYSVEIFGKTKLGQLLLFAKQSQDTTLMNQLIDSIRPAIIDLIRTYSIDGIVFIPPTVKREQQLMKQLAKRLALNVRTLSIVKVKTPVIVPQKTLNKLEDRIINARETIVVDDLGSYTNVLLIDDAVGSGATLNEVAKKIRQRGISRGKIVGLAITGSVKGFDVISEV